MKKVTKILALLLAMLVAMTSLVACKKVEETEEPGGKKPSQTTNKDKKSDDEELVEETAEAFLDALTSFDTKEAAKYVVEGSEAEEELESFDMESMFDGAEEYGITDKDIDKIMNSLAKKMTYEIEEIEVDEDTAEVAITLPSFDGDFNPMESVSEEDALMMIADKMGYDSAEDFMADAQAGNVTQEDMMEYMGEVIVELFEISLEDVEFEARKGTLILEKIDDEWFVAESK